MCCGICICCGVCIKIESRGHFRCGFPFCFVVAFCCVVAFVFVAVFAFVVAPLGFRRFMRHKSVRCLETDLHVSTSSYSRLWENTSSTTSLKHRDAADPGERISDQIWEN
ncbi:hypothetical protein NL108_015801 [Boleophthalmus pectinirostris]|nr:hypothetical protein NL108_015801 [Boleophthalmus pectinirostris]